jgi:hypothetical protein
MLRHKKKVVFHHIAVQKFFAAQNGTPLIRLDISANGSIG